MAVAERDLPAIMFANAYGTSVASNDNTCSRAAEVIVDGESMHVTADREMSLH